MDLFSAWAGFAVCLALIAAAGPVLCRNADVIADKTGLSGNWIGLILVATVTSLPELATGASAVALADAPNIAVGDVLGSSVFNLTILAVLDFVQRGENIYRRVGMGHVVSAGYGIMLIGFVGMNILLHGQGTSFAVYHVDGSTFIMLGLYVLAMRTVFRYEFDHVTNAAELMASRYPDLTLKDAILRYSIAAIVIVAAGLWLPFVAKDLAEIMGWRTSFVGTMFVAAVTSAPELIVTVIAVRISAIDIAIANLLGSNLFNIVVLCADDLLYTRGPILSAVSPEHAVTAASAVIMSGIVIVGLVYRPAARVFRTVGWASLGLFAMYLLNSYALFHYGG